MTSPAPTPRKSTRRILGAVVAVGLALGGVAVAAAPAQAATYTVDTLIDVVNPVDGVTSLREAITDSQTIAGPDSITFAPGLTGTIHLTSTLPIISQNLTIDGTGATITVSIDDSLGAGFRFLQINAGDVTFSDFRITDDGVAVQVGSHGLYIFAGGTITLDDMVFVNFDSGAEPGGCIIGSAFTAVVMNRTAVSSCEVDAGQVGGGVFLVGGTFSATDSNFNANHADDGGAVRLVNSLGVTLLRTTIETNQATVGDGGGLSASLTSGAVVITDSTIRDNAAVDEGGGAYISTPGAITVTNSTFSTNSAARGAGIYFGGTPFNVAGSRFIDNTATGSGGAIGNGNGFFTGTISDTRFESNQADDGAAFSAPIDANFTFLRSSFVNNEFDSSGAIQVGGSGIDNGTLTIDSSSFSGQRQYAGAVDLATGASLFSQDVTDDGALVIVNTTLDETENVGSALYLSSIDGSVSIRNSTARGPSMVLEDVDGTVLIENSIVESLVADSDPFIGIVDFGTFTVRRSIVYGPIHAFVTDGGGNLFSTNPNLGALALNGGATLNRLPNAGSPAIDSGDPAFVAPPALDQRGAGFVRIVNSRVDIGAVEVQAPVAGGGGGALLPPTGGTVSWWLLFVAGGALLLGVGSLVLTRRRKAARH